MPGIGILHQELSNLVLIDNMIILGSLIQPSHSFSAQRWGWPGFPLFFQNIPIYLNTDSPTNKQK